MGNQLQSIGSLALRGEVEGSTFAVSVVWSRISARLDRLLSPAEECVATLFELPLNTDDANAALANRTELASWLGDVASPRAVTLTNRLNDGIRRRMVSQAPDAHWAVEGAALIEDIRADVELSSSNATSGARLLFVGPESAEADSAVWAAVSAGFTVGLEDAVGSNEPDVVVIVGDRGRSNLQCAAARAHANHPHAHVLIAADLRDPADQIALSTMCDVVLAGPIRPLRVLDEVRTLLARRSLELRFVQLRSHIGPSKSDLEAHGLSVIVADDVAAVLANLESDSVNALLVTSVTLGEHRALINLVRTKPETRQTIIVECTAECMAQFGGEYAGEHAEHGAARHTEPEALGPTPSSSLPDVDVPFRSGAAGVAAGAAGVIRRRSQLGAIERTTTPAGLPWFSGRARGEQLLQVAQRNDRPATLGLLRFAASVPVADVDRIQSHLNRQFRDSDVVVRRNDRENVVVVDGIGRRTTMSRLGAVIDEMVGVDVRACVGEQPYDGRNFEMLLESIESALDRSKGEDVSPVIGVDWQSTDLRSDYDVLLVEPDKSLAAVLRGGLRRLGVTTRSVATADAALAELLDPTRRKPRLVVLEFDLPGIDGLATLRLLDRAGVLGRLNVMMLGSRTREVDVAAAFDMGVVDIVAKPLFPQLTMHRIQRLLSR